MPGVTSSGDEIATISSAQAFDLNIEKVLEHWPVAFAVREVIANAIDEQAITSTASPEILKTGNGEWVVRDFGRGLRYDHLTQKENPEKLGHPAVIGQFGIGLKDAFAVFDRREVAVTVRSRYAEITTAQMPKAGFPDVVTLHAVVALSPDREMIGTEVRLVGVSDADITAAMGFFLCFSDSAPLESTRYGQVLARPSPAGPGRIYVKGLLVAEEPNFLFSYNITAINAPLRRALNRERTNVGRTAYSERVKDVLKECRSPAVAGPLTADLARFTSGRMHDELGWKDVAVHACRVLQTTERVLFTTVAETGLASIRYAREDGYRIIIVPDDIARALTGLTDLNGEPMFDLGRFHDHWNDSFSYRFVDPNDLEPAERAVYDLTVPAAALAGVDLENRRITVAVSETTRLSERGAEVVGVWEPAERRIVVRRDQLADARGFCGTLLHELTHALFGFPDLTFEFEEALSTQMGTVAHAGLSGPAAPAGPSTPR
jgi:hypothetical protein